MPYQPGEIKPNNLTLEQVSVGQTFELVHTVTLADVKAFANLTGDYNPVHVDANFAKRTMFGKQVVHGMLTASFISTMIGMLIPGPGALWTSQTIEFLSPTFIGDIITIVAKVKAKSNSTRMISLEMSIHNQNNTKLIIGDSTVRMLEIAEETRKDHLVMNEIDKVTEPKVVLVTGGSRGIGAAIATLLASKGHAVVVSYLSAEEEVQTLVKRITEINGRIIAVKGDIANETEVAKLFTAAEKKFGPVQAVVHCAAPNPIPQTFDSLDWQTFQKHVDTQIQGAFHCAKHALPKMTASGTGAFVFLSSIFAEGVPPTHQTAYVTVKAGLAAMARSLAVEYGPKGIRVNVVSPGMTHTEMISNIPDKVKMLAKMNTPLRRLADAEDVAATIDFLLSPAARHITGENIRVCGGVVM
jgi:3-oxoacyl-[acyl-carrier protein] reductase